MASRLFQMMPQRWILRNFNPKVFVPLCTSHVHKYALKTPTNPLNPLGAYPQKPAIASMIILFLGRMHPPHYVNLQTPNPHNLDFNIFHFLLGIFTNQWDNTLNISLSWITIFGTTCCSPLQLLSILCEVNYHSIFSYVLGHVFIK